MEPILRIIQQITDDGMSLIFKQSQLQGMVSCRLYNPSLLKSVDVEINFQAMDEMAELPAEALAHAIGAAYEKFKKDCAELE